MKIQSKSLLRKVVSLTKGSTSALLHSPVGSHVTQSIVFNPGTDGELRFKTYGASDFVQHSALTLNYHPEVFPTIKYERSKEVLMR